MVVWQAWNTDVGIDPFDHKLTQVGHVTHGQLPENRIGAATKSLGVNLKKFPMCRKDKVVIAGFNYLPGDFTANGQAALHSDDQEGPVDLVRQRRCVAVGLSRHLLAELALQDVDLPQHHDVQVPVRAEHRHLLPAGQRLRELRLRSAGRGDCPPSGG